MYSRDSNPELHITFVIAVNDREVFEGNFLASPCVHKVHDHQIIIQENFLSASRAYNEALSKSANDLIVFCHQDVYLPERWLWDLRRALDYLRLHDPNWGVLGCSGMTSNREHWRYLYSSGLGISGSPFEHPKSVQTLDELILIIRKSSGLQFDVQLSHFHLYGTDICLEAMRRGMKCYTISAFCIHNTHQPLVLPAEFYDCCKHIKRRWRTCLPIYTTCVKLTRFNIPLYARRLREAYLRYIRRRKVAAARLKDVSQLARECAGATEPECRGTR